MTTWALTSSIAYLAGATPPPFVDIMHADEWASPEQQELAKRAQEALRSAQSPSLATMAREVGEDDDYITPPLMFAQTVRVKVRRGNPLPPPTLDEDDLPL